MANIDEAIECPVERMWAEDLARLQDAAKGRYGEDQKRIADEVVRWGTMLLKKNRDYGSSVWNPPMFAPDCDAGTAIRVRMSDKASRLIALLGKNPEVNESTDDTLRDFGAYCLLELARPGR